MPRRSLIGREKKEDTDMAALNGKWRLVSLENFEPYLDAVGMCLCSFFSFLSFAFAILLFLFIFFMLTGGWARLF